MKLVTDSNVCLTDPHKDPPIYTTLGALSVMVETLQNRSVWVKWRR